MAPRKSKPRLRRPPGYAKVKNGDLVEKLIARGLPHDGRKAVLIARLESDDARQAAKAEAEEDAANEQLREATGAATPYTTAYIGPGTRGGKFDHVVRRVEDIHRQKGYWRFATSEDEKRANARGISAPEQMLIDEARCDATLDDVKLSWRPGSEAEDKTTLTMSASQHISTLYDMKKILGGSVSFKNEVPIYPTVLDTRVKPYWATVIAAQQSRVASSAVITAPPLLAPSLAPIPGPVSALSSSSRAIPTSRPTIQSHRTRLPQQSDTLNLSDALTSFDRHDESHPHRVDLQTVLPSTPPARTPSPCISTGILQADTSAPFKNVPVDTLLDNSSVSEPDQEGGDDAPLTIELDSMEDPMIIASIERPATPDFLKGLPLPPSCYTPPPTRNTSLPDIFDNTTKPDSKLPSPTREPPLQTPIASQHAPPSPQSHEPTPDFDPEDWGGVDQIMQDLAAFDVHKPVLELDESVATPTEVVLRPTSLSPVSDSHESKEEDRVPENEGSPELPTGDDVPVEQGIVAEQEPEAMDCQSDYGVIPALDSPEPQAEELPTAPTDYLDIPCMDCGWTEARGHASECYVGKIAFSDNLSMLDHRRLADAVQSFDPGPWTTHFDQYPTPPAEDPELVISGMADVIRNEDTYNHDTSLHGLPDSDMVLLWALKTLPDVHIITD